ncbi:MAG: hypothetical protein DSZ12_04575, partial [Sulfurovum sp.]
MKILYVKSNSERDKSFQLRTIIYEEHGQKYVKKQALCKEAIPHLKNMKKNYEALLASILDPQIKLSKIIKEEEDSLTFEFIEGISFARKFEDASKVNKQEALIKEYLTLLKTGFKTIPFDHTSMVTKTFKTLFGEDDYTTLDGQLCFKGISNLDLIFSNIIFKEKEIYIIDYEWVFDTSVPIDYVSFRQLHPPVDIYWKMEQHFIYDFVAKKDSFLHIQEKYLQQRPSIEEDIKNKDAHVKNMDLVVQDKERIIKDKDKHIQTQEDILQKKDALVESLNTIIKDKDKHIQTQEDTLQKKDALVESL